MENQGLDYLDKLFISHYRELESKESVTLVPYKANDERPGILFMEYTTEQGIHTTIKIDKHGCMYNLRSEKHYKSMNADKAFEFSRSIAEKYHGYRCNAYDDIMIMQLTGTFRDLKETEAEELLKNSIVDYENTMALEFSEFEAICETVTLKKNETKSNVDEAFSEVVDPDLEEDDDTFEIESFGWENIVSASDTGGHLNEEAPVGHDTHEELDVDAILKQISNAADPALEGNHVSDETKSETNFEIPLWEDGLITVQESNQIRMIEYLKKYFYEEKIKYTHTDFLLSAQYFVNGIRYSVKYEIKQCVMKLRLSKKYEIDLRENFENIKDTIDSSAILIKGNIIAFDRVITDCDPLEFQNTIEILLTKIEETDLIVKEINDNCFESNLNQAEFEKKDINTNVILTDQPSNDIVYAANKDKFEQWEALLKKQELFLNGQKKEIMQSIQDLNARSQYIREKEQELYREQQKLEQGEKSFAVKNEELAQKELVLKSREDTQHRREKALNAKEQELNSKSSVLKEQEVTLNENTERVRVEQEFLDNMKRDLEVKRVSIEQKSQKLQIQANSLSNQIRLLESQKNDLEDIIKMKSGILKNGVSVDALEEQFSGLQNELGKKEKEIALLKKNLLSSENKVISCSQLEEKYEKCASDLKKVISMCSKAKCEKEKLEEMNASLKLKIESLRKQLEKTDSMTHDADNGRLKEELRQAQSELEILKTQKSSSDNTSENDISSEDFIKFLREEKDADPDMLKELHAEDGNLIKIDGNIQILISFKKGMNFVEAVKETHASGKMLKKIETFNANGSKTIIFTTNKQVFCRTMFRDASADEIYKIMEEAADILSGI